MHGLDRSKQELVVFKDDSVTTSIKQAIEEKTRSSSLKYKSAIYNVHCRKLNQERNSVMIRKMKKLSL